MGKDKKDKKHKKKPEDIVDIKKFDPKTGLIDAKSILEYKSAYSQYKAKNEKEANPKLEEHIETRLHKTVEEQKKKRKRDITSVAASTAAGTLVPFSGIPIMIATTMVQCVGFSASLGLIPVANIRSFQDANTLASQMTDTLKKASTSGMKAAIEAFVLEALKQAGIGKWLWEEILKDIVIETSGGVITESAWIITPLFAAPKYMLHRKLIKKMYVSLGEKAIVVHKAWVTAHLFLGKPETGRNFADETVAAAAAAVAELHPGYQSAYPSTGQLLYESNSEEGVPYPVYYQPAFASSAHAEEHPHQAPPVHSNSFPLQHPHSQYAYYPPSYPMHIPQGQTSSSYDSQYRQWYGPPQQYTAQPGPYGSNPLQPPPANSNPLVSHVHTNSMPHHVGPYGSPAITSSNPGTNYSQAPPLGYPQQGQDGKMQSTPQRSASDPLSSNSASSNSQAPPLGYPL